jgi:TonB-linked SusC/RagA family outer membrane protein
MSMKRSYFRGLTINVIPLLKKISRSFTVAACLLLVFSPLAIASKVNPDKATVTMNKQNVSLETVLNDIENQTGVLFVTNSNDVDLNVPVSLNVRNERLPKVLDKLFAGTGISYQEEGVNVILSKQTPDETTQSDFIKLTGTIKDENGSPIIGAGVTVEGTTTGAVTDENGNFTLEAKPTDRLSVSCIGYVTKIVSLDGRSHIDIVLSEDKELLDEVVVIGYGSARKGDLTGPISSVKGESLTERSTQMLSTAMQGQLSGVQVTRSSGGPGSSATIRVRGVTTMSNNDPLVIIDGVPGSLNDVIASDVETISVFKDAASASIYGSRAAAGVIVITTKRASKDKFNFDYSYEYAIDKPTTRPSNGDVIDWMNVQNEVKWNDGASSPYSQYSQETISSWMENNAKDPYHYPNTDWVDLILKNTASHQQHNLNVTGGTDKLRSKFSFTYQTGEGYYEHRSYDRYAGRINNDFNITPWLHASLDVHFSASESVSPSTVSPIYGAYLVSPYYNAYWEDGRYADVKDGANYLAALKDGGTNNGKYYKFGGKLQLDVTPFKGLTLSAVFAPEFAFYKGKNFKKAVNVYYENGSSITTQFCKATSLTESRNDNNSRTYQFYANYKGDWGEHSLSAMAGYEGYTYKWENEGAWRNNYTLDSYPYLNIGPEDYQYNSGSAGHNAYESVFGRVIYSFKQRYIFQANIRGDGSSRFSSKYRWGAFPSISAGWVASSEPWFPSTWKIDFLKLRASIGTLGNERISSSEFPYQALMTFGNSYMYDKSKNSVVAVQNAAQVYYAFDDITWETTKTYGVGLDMNMFKSRLNFTGDIYYKKTSDMLLTLGFPSYVGYSAPTQNAGDMHTKGWEIEIGWNDRIGDFSYGASFNLSDYRSKMGYLGDKKTVNGNYLLEEDSYYNEWYMYKTDGLFITDEDLVDENGNAYPTLTRNDKAGNIKYVDVNEDGIINADDKVKLGNSQPEYIYGGSLYAGWKSFDLSISFQGVGHRKVLFNSAWIQPLKEQWGAVPSLLLGNYWSQNNTEEQNRKAKYPRLTYTNTTNTYTGSDYWLFNGAYFRIKNITLGYTLPQNLTQKFFVKGLRFYFTITDLPAISNYPDGWDPEVGTWSEFISTSYIFGARINF